MVPKQLSTTVRYCGLTSKEQQKQQDLIKRIQQLEAGIANKQEEDEVKIGFKNRDKLRQSMMIWNDFEDDFEEFDETTEEDQLAKIEKMERLIEHHAADLEDIEKENLDSRMVMMSEYKEQLKMVDFFKELIHTQISKGELDQLRIQSKWSDKDNEFKVPVFYAKNGKVNPVKLPKHELILKLAELYQARTLRLKTDHMVQKVAMSLNLDEELEPLDDSLFANQRIDSSLYNPKSNTEVPMQRSKYVNSNGKPRTIPKQKQSCLPPVYSDN